MLNVDDMQRNRVPRPLSSGLFHGNLYSYVAVQAGSAFQSEHISPADRQQMAECLAAVHQQQMVHWDVHLSIYVRAPAGHIWLIDFDNSYCAPV